MVPMDHPSGLPSTLQVGSSTCGKVVCSHTCSICQLTDLAAVEPFVLLRYAASLVDAASGGLSQRQLACHRPELVVC
jgi:hypothetical protein